jgi:hypothetical protein
MDHFLLNRYGAALHSTSFASFAASLEEVVANSLDFFPENVEMSLQILFLPTSRMRVLIYTIYLLNFVI